MEDLNLGEISIDASGETEDFAAPTSQMEQCAQPLDSFEAERTKKVGKCNMRKSLAWDAAFFTSAGVLDADELSCMIDGGSISKSQVLPGIEEEIYQSTDSLSTLGSENLTLESLEVGLFEDIRASIQNSSKASNRENPIKATSPLKEDLASWSVAKSSAGPKKQTSRMQTPGRLNVQSFNSPKVTHSVAGSGVPMPSLQKATRASGRPIPGPKGPSSITKLAPVPKAVDPKRTVPRPVLPSKSSYSCSSTATMKEPTKLSSDSSTSTQFANSNPRRIASRSVNPTSTNSDLKPPSKVAIKKKVENGLSSSRSSKLSSSISPASSISEWSVGSSSSTSSVNQCSKPQDNAAPKNNVRRSNDRGLDRHENKMSRPNNEKTNAQRGPLLKPATAKPSGLRVPLPNNVKPNAASAHSGQPPKPETAKPSGLRMPSPKIGFFDGVKAVVNTPGGSSQARSGVLSSPKVGTVVSIPARVSSKAKSPKLQPTRLAKPVGNIKLDTQTSASPLPPKKVSNASDKVHSSPKNVETPLKLSHVTQNGTDEEKFSKTEERRVEKLSDTNDEETEMISRLDVGEKISANLMNLKIVPVDGDIYDCKGKTVSEEKNNFVYTNDKINTADLKSNVDLDGQMTADLVNLKIVPVDRDICDYVGKMSSEEKSKDVKSITENFSPANLKSEMTLEQNLKANSVKLKIDQVDGEIHDCDGEMASEEKNKDATSITKKISPFDLNNDLKLDVKISANSGDTEIVPVDGEIYDFESNMSSEEKINSVTSVINIIVPADVKKDTDLDVTMNANSEDMEIVPADREVYCCERKMALEEKNNDVISITEKTSSDDVMEVMNLDVEMSPKSNSGNVKICLVDKKNYDREEKLTFEEKRNDEKSNTEIFGLADLKSNINLEVNMSASLKNLEIVLLDADSYDCERKIVSEEKSNGAVSIDDKITQDLESDMNMEKKLAQYLHNEYLHIHRIEMNQEGKSNANSVKVKVTPMDGDIYEKELVCHEKTDDGKSEIKLLINKLNSPHRSAEKENQVKCLSLDVEHGYSEHDLQKENATNFISSPKNFCQTEELFSNMSKISQISETVASSRTPFTEKNSSSNDERGDISIEFIAEGMEKITLVPSLECPPAEN